MAHVILNSVTFSGLPDGTGNQSGWQPTGYAVKEAKVGVTLVAANGTRNRVERSAFKHVWTITWEKTNLATVSTLRTIQRLYTTWTFTDFDSAAYTVRSESDDFEFEHNFISGSTGYFDVTLVIYEA